VASGGEATRIHYSARRRIGVLMGNAESNDEREIQGCGVRDELRKVPSVIALARRRIDREKITPARFRGARARSSKPLARLLAQECAVALVSSAACGADLIGLAETERLGMRRRIVLRFFPYRFREESVADCPGDWTATSSARGIGHD
jgi:hypothetical protein